MDKSSATTETPTKVTRKRKSNKDSLSIDARPDHTIEGRKAKRRKKQDDGNSDPNKTESIGPKEKEGKGSGCEAVLNSGERVILERDESLNTNKTVVEKGGDKVKGPKRMKGRVKEKTQGGKQTVADAGDLTSHVNEDSATKEVDQAVTIQSALVPAKKKKRTNRTGFPDPNEDTSLSDQSRKSLAYAFAQFYRPSKWKFHKARQNWLVRNILSGDTIPEIYFPLAMAYLAKVQGGARENLLKHCRTCLEPPKVQVLVPETAPDNSPTAPVAPTPPDIDLIKVTRAKSLLHSLGDDNDAKPDSDDML